MMLAENTLHQPGLAKNILGPTINQRQIFTEATVMARLQSGELDAASAYKIQPGPFNLPWVQLPPAVNLANENLQSEFPDIKLTLGEKTRGEKTFMPEPLIYYAAALKDAPNSRGAAQFIEWLKGPEVQNILRRYQYDAPGGARALRPMTSGKSLTTRKWLLRGTAAVFALALLTLLPLSCLTLARGSGLKTSVARH